MRMANSFDGENLQYFEVYQTPQEYEKALELIRNFISKADSTHPDNKFCFGLPGTYDLDKKTLVSAPNLQLWVGRPLRKDLEAITKSSVVLMNDAELAGLGEAVKGAGKDHKIVAFVTLGTGVGGVRIVNGNVDVSKYGFEPGHQIIQIKDESVAEFKELEDLIGGSSIKINYSKPAEEINDPDIWKKIMDELALGINNLIVFWSPDVVVLGGGIAHNDFIDVQKIHDKVGSFLKVFPTVPEIKKSSLGEKSAIYGGLELLKKSYS